MKCPSCFTENIEAASFCRHCGIALKPSAPMSFGQGSVGAPSDLNAATTSYHTPASGSNYAPSSSADTVGYQGGYAAAPTPPRAEPVGYAAPSQPSNGSASGYRRPTPARSINRKPPLPGVLVAIVAALSTILLFFNVAAAIEGSTGSLGFWMNLFYEAGLEDAYYAMLDLYEVIAVFVLISCLFDLGSVIGMWLTFGGCIGKTVRPTYSAGLMVIKIMRIFYAIGSIAVAAIMATACVIGSFGLFATVPSDYMWLPILTFVLGTGYFVWTIIYQISIFRTLNNMRKGASTGEYGPASGFLIFCLFATAMLSLVFVFISLASAPFGMVDPVSIFTGIIGVVLPILQGISMIVYNSRR